MGSGIGDVDLVRCEEEDRGKERSWRQWTRRRGGDGLQVRERGDKIGARWRELLGWQRRVLG